MSVTLTEGQADHAGAFTVVDGHLTSVVGNVCVRVPAVAVLSLIAAESTDVVRRSCPDLRLRSSPLPVSARVRGSVADGFVVDLVARKGLVVAAVDSGDDSIVIGRAWHPIDVSTGQMVDELLASTGLEVGVTFRLGGFLRLLADPASDHLVVDESAPADPASDRSTLAFIEPPPGLNATLYPYQRVGAAFLRSRAANDVGALLADEMGLGKTMQVIALLLAERRRGPSLVVMPASLIPNWQRELKLFAPSLSVLPHMGPWRAGVASSLIGWDVVLVSYETLVSDEVLFAGISWNLLAADEAQRIRNPEAGRSRAIRRIPARLRVAVTGSPVENSLVDLWSVADFILPSVLGDHESFLGAFPDEEHAARHLGRLVQPLSIRRMVASVAQDLPDITQSQVPVPLEDGDAHLHDELVASGEPFGAESKLSLLCAHAGEEMTLGTFRVKPKVDFVLDLLDEVFRAGQKALIFARFTRPLDRLAAVIHELAPGAFVGILDGRLPIPERLRLIDAFDETPVPGCLLLNPEAGGVGLNITAANHVIHFTPNWNPKVTDQATARAYRRGQDLPVFVHHLAYAGSIEERALDRGDWKRDLAAAVDEGLIMGDLTGAADE